MISQEGEISLVLVRAGGQAGTFGRLITLLVVPKVPRVPST